MTQEELKKVLFTVYRNIRCPQCGTSYDFGHIHIKGYVNNLCFLELHCKNHLPLFATIATPPKTENNASPKPLDSDYLISAYETINKLDTNLNELLKK